MRLTKRDRDRTQKKFHKHLAKFLEEVQAKFKAARQNFKSLTDQLNTEFRRTSAAINKLAASQEKTELRIRNLEKHTHTRDLRGPRSAEPSARSLARDEALRAEPTALIDLRQ